MSGGALVNTGAPGWPWPDAGTAQDRVLKIQAKLHRWAKSDPRRSPGPYLLAWRWCHLLYRNGQTTIVTLQRLKG